jgi:hypothetical protein
MPPATRRKPTHREGKLKKYMRGHSAGMLLASICAHTSLFGFATSPVFSAETPKTSKADRLECRGPYQLLPGAPILKWPVGKARVGKGRNADICVSIKPTDTIDSARCIRTELIAEKYPQWQCPVDQDCFSGGIFKNFMRPSSTNVCISFQNTGSVDQDVSVSFAIIP